MNTITTVSLALLLIGVGTVWNLRSFIRTEIQASTATTNATLEKAVAGVREEIHAGERRRNHQMAEIRRIITRRTERMHPVKENQLTACGKSR